MENTKVILGKKGTLVRFSYVNVIDPKPNLNGEEKHTISLIIPKNSKDLEDIKQAIENTLKNNSSKWGGKDPHKIKNFKWPLKDGDERYPDNPEYANSYFVNASSARKPDIIDVKGVPIVDKEELYSGCYGRASFKFYGFNKNANIGITADLHNLQKVQDGDRLGGVSKAEDDFGDVIEEVSDFL